MKMLVIVPTRGRPANVLDQWTTLPPSGMRWQMSVWYAINDDDPERGGYHNLLNATNISLHRGPPERMVPTLNRHAVIGADRFDIVGFMGDDHRPRTEGWAKTIADELERLGTGIVYGNDLIQGANLPTAVFMTSDIIRTLGWMAPPGLLHLFPDNAWRDLGEALGALSYLSDVIIEHLHPIAGKGEWDEHYTANNDSETWEHDQAVYETWRAESLHRDAAKIRAARAAA